MSTMDKKMIKSSLCFCGMRGNRFQRISIIRIIMNRVMAITLVKRQLRLLIVKIKVMMMRMMRMLTSVAMSSTYRCFNEFGA